MAGFWVFDPDVVATGIFEPFAASFPVSSAGNMRGEVVGGAADYKDELLGVDFKGD